MENLEIRVQNLEGGMAEMRGVVSSSNSLVNQLQETLKDLGNSFREFSATNIKMQVVMEGLSKEIERGNKNQESMNKKIDSLARFAADIESIRGVQQVLDEREKRDFDNLEKKIEEVKKDFEKHLEDFKEHDNKSKIDVVSLAKNGASWILNIVLAAALLWSLFGKDVNPP